MNFSLLEQQAWRSIVATDSIPGQEAHRLTVVSRRRLRDCRRGAGPCNRPIPRFGPASPPIEQATTLGREDIAVLRTRLQRVMSRDVAVVGDATGLARAHDEMEAIEAELGATTVTGTATADDDTRRVF